MSSLVHFFALSRKNNVNNGRIYWLKLFQGSPPFLFVTNFLAHINLNIEGAQIIGWVRKEKQHTSLHAVKTKYFFKHLLPQGL
ncbi:hypothetical protein PBF_24658 [Cytobacillus firmus DS1]|uniref:Uncharacterized protein n=1 Tax=Cytobacillus firmus DS1 TaxID=1307436 RepID=W7KQE3_CYTFI|nr:hypothetical protein PBF_24658 [Cytobacillus firmus DS1]